MSFEEKYPWLFYSKKDIDFEDELEPEDYTDPDKRARRYLELGLSEFGQLEFKQAKIYLYFGLEIYRELTNRKQIAYILEQLGEVSVALHDRNAARRYYSELVSSYRDVIKSNDAANVLQHLANIEAVDKKYELAIAYYEQSQEILQKQNNRLKVALCKIQIGYYFALLKSFDMSVQLLNEGLKLAEDLKSLTGMATAYQYMGAICSH